LKEGPRVAVPTLGTRRGPWLGLALAVSAFVFFAAALAGAETIQNGTLRVAFSGKFSPQLLPRHGSTPISVSIGGHISTTNGEPPPQLRRIAIAFNRSGRLSSTGLPVCRLEEIQPATNEGALRSCRRSLVGEGSFSANVVLPEQAPFPSRGKVFAFNGRMAGRPVILAHVYGTEPVPTSYTLPFAIRDSAGRFGTVLSASLPRVTADWGFVTGIDLTLGRRFNYRGRQHGYFSAECPAPSGFPGAVFPLARASLSFAHGPTVSSVMNRTCQVITGTH
jgi:hypothetical protein